MSFALRQGGFDVEAQSSLEELAEALSKEHPQLIFLDVLLNGGDAIDAIRVLHQSSFGGQVQLMSGFDLEQLEPVRRVGEARNLRMLPPLSKPVQHQDLRNAVHRMNMDAKPSLVRSQSASLDKGE